MKKFYIILLTSIFLWGCSKKESIKISEDSTIVAFGDSLTFGYGASQNESYPNVLKEKIGINVVNEGISGNTTKDGVNRIEAVISEHNPSLILVGLGGNDMLRNVSEEETKENLSKIIKISQSKGIQVILLATPKPSGLGLIGYLSDAEFYKELAEQHNVLLIEDVYSKWLEKNEYKSDQIHLNSKGYQKVAEHIAEFLKEENLIN
jgi:lysophospholipase L1-like esterase